jgi:predicted alpha/beta-hydrolase family hydrolase
MAGPADLTAAAKAMKGKVSFHWIDTADHGYRPLKASGKTSADVLAEVADASVAWVAQLAG